MYFSQGYSWGSKFTDSKGKRKKEKIETELVHRLLMCPVARSMGDDTPSMSKCAVPNGYN